MHIQPRATLVFPRLRLQRIKRNQERLAQLGLLGPRPEKRKHRKTIREQPVGKRQSLSRQSKQKEVDYSGVLDLRTFTRENIPRKEKVQDKPDKPREEKEKKTKER